MYWVNTTSRFPSILTIFLSVGFVLWAGLPTPTWAEDDPAAIADLTGDGTVAGGDFSTLISRFGLQAGQAGYREGLDLVPDTRHEIDVAVPVEVPQSTSVVRRTGPCPAEPRGKRRRSAQRAAAVVHARTRFMHSRKSALIS